MGGLMGGLAWGKGWSKALGPDPCTHPGLVSPDFGLLSVVLETLLMQL